MTNNRILEQVGHELREAREGAGLTQQAISDLMGWSGRDAASKLERGLINISLCDYLEIIRALRETIPPSHPALLLVEYFMPPRRKRST